MNFIALYCPYRFFGTQKNASPVWGEATLLQTERFSAAFIIKVKAGGGKVRQAAASHTAADKPSTGMRLRRYGATKNALSGVLFLFCSTVAVVAVSALGFVRFSAFGAARRLVLETLFRIELLFAGGEGEFLTAVSASQNFVSHVPMISPL